MRVWKVWAVSLMLLALGGLGCKRAAEPATTDKAASRPPATDEIRLNFSYGSEKQPWVEDVTAVFNRSQGKTASGIHITVQAIPKGSGELVEDLIAGRDHADLASPATGIFIKLNNARSRAPTVQDLIGSTHTRI